MDLLKIDITTLYEYDAHQPMVVVTFMPPHDHDLAAHQGSKMVARPVCVRLALFGSIDTGKTNAAPAILSVDYDDGITVRNMHDVAAQLHTVDIRQHQKQAYGK